MPLFSNKFTPKRPAPRKAKPSEDRESEQPEEDFSVEVGPIKLKLGDQESVFQDGQWIPGTIYL